MILGALHRPWAFHKGELVTIYIMMTLANGTHPLVHYWVSELPGIWYYATPENDWSSRIHPYIPDWISPRGFREVKDFYEGIHGESTGIVWKVWLVPLVCWLPLFVAVHVATLCLMVILRRQWMERERLIYPLVQVSLAMIQEDERG